MIILLTSIWFGTRTRDKDTVIYSNLELKEAQVTAPITDKKKISITFHAANVEKVSFCFKVEGKPAGKIVYQLYRGETQYQEGECPVAEIEDQKFEDFFVGCSKENEEYRLELRTEGISRGTKVSLYCNTIDDDSIIMQVDEIPVMEKPIIRLIGKEKTHPYLWDVCLLNVFLLLVLFAFKKKK